jgi:hypothetical protein
MRIKSLLVAVPCAAAIAVAGAAPAFAGEYNAHMDRTGAYTNAQSVCSTSGLNLDEPGGRTQSFGEFAREGLTHLYKSIGFGPGDACNGRTGLLAGGGEE